MIRERAWKHIVQNEEQRLSSSPAQVKTGAGEKHFHHVHFALRVDILSLLDSVGGVLKYCSAASISCNELVLIAMAWSFTVPI